VGCATVRSLIATFHWRLVNLSLVRGILERMIWPAPGVTADHLANVLDNVNGFSQPILAVAHGAE
jgi:hypothetical protein